MVPSTISAAQLLARSTQFALIVSIQVVHLPQHCYAQQQAPSKQCLHGHDMVTNNVKDCSLNSG